MTDEQIINDFMSTRYEYQTIEDLWPVLKKIRTIAQGNPDYLQPWMGIASGLYAIDLDMVYKFTLEFIIYYKNLNT